MENIEQQVKDIIVDKLGVDANEVKPEASFTNDLGADSLDTVELIMSTGREMTSVSTCICWSVGMKLFPRDLSV